MGEKEEKEKAEKLAAAKKRVAQLQKKKKATTGTSEKTATTSSKTKSKGKSRTEDEEALEEPQSPVQEFTVEAPENDDAANEEEEDPDTTAFNDAITKANTAAVAGTDEDMMEHTKDARPANSPSPDGERTAVLANRPGRQPSISVQSKIRSASFRNGPGPLSPSGTGIGSPEGEELSDVYRKQLSRIEELEHENKRLAKEVQENEARWRKNEEDLEELREKTAEGTSVNQESREIQKLKSELESLRRSQRQSVSLGSGKAQQSSVPNEDIEHLRSEIDSKDTTISDLQLEISRLRSESSTHSQGRENRDEQITALQTSLERAEASVKKLELELSDTKKSLSRVTEKAVLDGTETTSKDTKIRNLERDFTAAQTAREDAEKRVDQLEKKIEAMNKLHREAEQRNAAKLSSVESSAREAALLKAKLETLEKENGRLREEKKRKVSHDGGNDGLDELEDEERAKLERKIRELEGENFDLRRGVWRDKRREMQPDFANPEAGQDEFDEVDLHASTSSTRRPSSFMPAPMMQARHSGFTQVINSGLAAFRASTTSPDSQQAITRPRNDSLLQEFDDDDDSFDEQAFAIAQREEEMRKMVEHVREIKKGLKQWVGWRLDLVDVRRSGGGGIGFGEVFEV